MGHKKKTPAVAGAGDNNEGSKDAAPVSSPTEQEPKAAPKPKQRAIVGYRLMTAHYLDGRMRPEGFIASPALLKGAKPGSGMVAVYEGDEPPKEPKAKMPPPPTTGVRVRGMHIPDPADEI